MNFSFLAWPVRSQLASETDMIHQVRIRVISYALHLRILTNSILLFYCFHSGFSTLATRMSIMLGVVVSLYLALSAGLSWRKAIHFAACIFLLTIWGNLFLFDKNLSLASFQYAAIVSVCGFYGLGNFWGVIYAGLAGLAFLTFIVTGQPIGPYIMLGPADGDIWSAAMLLAQDFIFLLLIHYYFFNAFDDTIRKLDARTADLSKHLAAQEELRKKQEEEYVHQKHLLASISHDIKSPLRFLMVTTGRLAASHPDLPTVRAISQSSHRLYNFMKNLLEYTEFRYKSTGVDFAFMDMNELVEQKLEIFLVQAESNFIRLENQIEAGVILRSNIQLVGIILHNLIDNAIKVTYEGRIMISAEDHRNELHVIVSDTGRGMEQGIMNWINSAARIPGPDHNPQSFGMGLLIIREISALIHARLQAAPFEPAGTSIRIIFPKRRPGS